MGVRPENGQWIVKKLGGKSRIFSAKDEAIEVAKKKAASERVGVLVFEGGHVSVVSQNGDTARTTRRSSAVFPT
ncbi:MAG TPA: DUF2188 domain-containing protein [Chthoniobacterales bacterium]|nr:DUF2188 domain-containing protein [Chthoniobacterales bacterium]